ncbi:MAG: exodeoxyribonuclease VII large subunit [Cocleimonas sp.]|nr:exodeoxyribonuclease VII large subunit [Cocleimonas sp.]
MQTSNRTILNVSELNAEVNQLLTRGFPLLWVEGEISNLVRPASGHLYFTLKDNKSQIRSAMFRNRNMKLNIQPENGMKVLVRGRVGLYEPRGDYQLIAEHMEDAGVGQLQRQYEALKQKLADAGLFAEEHKKEFPEYPKRIGIITSPTGAAVRDILQVLSRRSPHTPVLIYPVVVQGEAAKTQIEVAIRQANIDKKCDVLILARGGGSIEDLWSFNEENVAKAIYNSEIPIACGVGHEIDFTIADFVADLRAPTPSAAAELITPDRNQLLTDVVQTQLWMTQTIKQNIKQKRQRLEWVDARLQLQKPSSKIQQQAQRLDELNIRLQQKMKTILHARQIQTNNLSSRLKSNTPSRKLAEQGQAFSHFSARLQQSINKKIQQEQSNFKIQLAMLDSISPLKTLERGYSIIKDSDSGDLITSATKLKPKQKIILKLKDGDAKARIED